MASGGQRLSADHCERVVNRLDQEIFLLDREGKVLFANRAAEQAVGAIESGAVSFREILRGGDDDFGKRMQLLAQSNQWMPINATVTRGPMEGVELRLKGHGFRNRETGALEVLLVADRNRDHGFLQLRELVRSLNTELAGKRRANTQLQSSLEAETRLHRELIHRVKNNLALLTALVGFRRKASDNVDVQSALTDLEMRIHAIRAVHDLLDQAGEIDYVQAGELIRSLCNQLENSILPEHIELENDLLDVTLNVHDATPLSLLVNELITNAAKHAFPDGRQGVVRVAFKKNGHDKLEVSIADNGQGFEPTETRRGSGSSIVEALARQIGGSLERESLGKGTKWTFVFPYRDADREGNQSRTVPRPSPAPMEGPPQPS